VPIYLYGFLNQKFPRKLRKIFLFIIVIALIYGCATEKKPGEERVDRLDEELPAALPMNDLSLDDLDAFQSPAKNWKIVGEVYADYQNAAHLETKDGAGILVRQSNGGSDNPLKTNIAHGDMELELDFLLSKGGKSSVFLQGRYAVQLTDSWGEESENEPLSGNINGMEPESNASFAPGLWQNLRIVFRAPRFNNKNEVTQPAVFKKVYLNEFLIHEDLVVEKFSEGAFFEEPSEMGPIIFSDGASPVAYKNIQYKIYSLDSLQLKNIAFEFYKGKEQWDKLPDFDNLEPDSTGRADKLIPSKTSPQKDKYGIVYTADLRVPREGDYLFETVVDDGGELFIDDALVVRNVGDPGQGTERGIVNLKEGKHSFKMSYYQDVWGTSLAIFYEGPQISRKLLSTELVVPERDNPPPMLLADFDQPELVRSFINHEDQKLTHTISVGSPKQIHYAYDLKNGSLILGWKGIFADMGWMWYERGEPQLLTPGNAVIELSNGTTVANLPSDDVPWEEVAKDIEMVGYRIENNRPVFTYKMDDISFEDKILPSDNGQGLKRIIKVKSESAKENTMYRMAWGREVKKLPNGLYRVDGSYYLSTDNKNAIIRVGSELVVPSLKNGEESEIEYSIIW